MYLVVDNTLDCSHVKRETLFPSGIPKNVFLIFTPSFAKLHQLGFDMATGGMIQIHHHHENAKEAQRLHEGLKTRLTEEDSRQSVLNAVTFDHLFFGQTEAEREVYNEFMILKRQRNTRALIESLRQGLSGLVETDSQRAVTFYFGKRDQLTKPKIRESGEPPTDHEAGFRIHFDPQSSIHLYLEIKEGEKTKKYIAGDVFEEIKRRVCERAAREGILLADGASWGFTTTRMDWYMHTMRIAVGLEHKRTLLGLGDIFSSVLRDLLQHPEDFLLGVETITQSPKFLSEYQDDIMALDRVIPHLSGRETSFQYYFESKEKDVWEYSCAIKNGDQIVSMIFAYETVERGSRELYVSKLATLVQYRGKGYASRLFDHVMRMARKNGISKIILDTSASKKNEPVIRAYERAGFRVYDLQGEFLTENDGWPLVKVYMELDLSRHPNPTDPHFETLGAQIYRQMNDSRDLSQATGIVEAYRKKLNSSVE